MSTIVLKQVTRAKRSRRGLTLIEAAMVLTILALTVAGVMLYYQNASTNQKTSETSGQIAAVSQAVRTQYAGQSSYTGLAINQLVNSVPRKMVLGTGVRNAFNGPVDVAPADAGGGAGSGFTVSFSGIPMEACMRLAVVDLGRAVLSVNVNGTAANPAPMTPNNARTACNSDNNNALIWTMY